MRIDQSKLDNAIALIGLLNRTPLSEIKWFEFGKEVEIDPAKIKEWKTTGLSNLDFYKMVIKNEN